ncbi:MAG: protein-L-isoaspartate(D-aspartate) O-methyltransferase [Planctomycetota bacterium]|nr:protein-L-isoaspartate(D-aspartate) O-methyltransferase [Planctomycetota bacterium]
MIVSIRTKSSCFGYFAFGDSAASNSAAAAGSVLRSAAAWLILVSWATAWGQAPDAQDTFAIERERLIRNVLIPGGIRDQRVLDSVAKTLRHEFVPPKYVRQAYLDIAIPIGESQTISSPFIVSLMTEALAPRATDKVLEIGTGSGYQAAILSPLVQDVYTIEIVEELGKQTTELLENLGYKNVHCRIGDGFKGWPEEAPFDKIIVTCSPADVPKPLVDQLKDGGLMVIPVGERYQQMLYLMRKKGDKLEKEALTPTLFVPMTGDAEKNRTVQPDPKRPALANASFEEALIREFHIPGWYYQFGCKQLEDPQAPEGKYVLEFQGTDPQWPNMLLQGIPIDGRVVKKIKLGAWIKLENVKVGREKEKSPSVAIQWFDSNRNRIGYNYVGGFKGTRSWKLEERQFPVPPEAREAIVSIGMFGSEGTAWFDGIVLEPQ